MGETLKQIKNSLLRKDDLSLFLEGNPDAWFLDEQYTENQYSSFRELGVSDHPKIPQSPLNRNQNGHLIIYKDHGRHERGLDGFDPEFTVQHLEHAVQHPTIERSLFIWKNIAIPHQHRIRGKVEKATRQSYESSRTESTLSRLGKTLVSNSWLPDSTGIFRKPSELSLTDLPEEFDQDESLAAHLEMRGSELVVLAKKSGFDIADLDLLRKLKENPSRYNKLKESLEPRKQKPSFPERPSTNTERRTELAREGAKTAPRKEYEVRTRSVRTSQAGGNKDTYLKEMYMNEDRELVCQMCEEEMPFRRRDGEHYFESVQLFDDLSGEHTATHLALCPVCAAKYKEFVKRDSNNASSLCKCIRLSKELVVFVRLGQYEGSIRFVEKHLVDIRAVLEEESDK